MSTVRIEPVTTESAKGIAREFEVESFSIEALDTSSPFHADRRVILTGWSASGEKLVVRLGEGDARALLNNLQRSNHASDLRSEGPSVYADRREDVVEKPVREGMMRPKTKKEKARERKKP